MRQAAFSDDTRGAAAIEFALISVPLFMMILFIMTSALILYWTLVMDYAVSKTARQVMTGYVQKNGITQANFQTQIFCPFLPSSIPCSDVTINLQTVIEASGPAGYYSYVNSSTSALLLPALGSTANMYNPGVQGAYQYLQVVYPVTFIPGFFTKILGGGAVYKGKPAFLIVSTAAFRNEQY